MVELCELKMLPEEDQWPADIDTRVANLDFGTDSVLFESFDPSVSTDSLDSEQLREQCRVRNDDFQLTFADSGHWQSGSKQQLTTWGRINSMEPLDEKTASAPGIIAGGRRRRSGSTAATVTTTTTPRPASLLANFVGRDSGHSDIDRYVDVNDNEIDFSPSDAVTTLHRTTDAIGLQNTPMDRWKLNRPSTVPRSAASSRPKRTFADLQKTSIAPELQFLALPHEVPTLCESSMNLSDVMLKVQRDGVPPITADFDFSLPPILQDATPDSGLGCSGPIHIEDWASLSILLPKHVAEACSFFKSNTQLLGASPATSPSQHSPNCIERSRRSEPCRTCFRVRRRIHPPNWAQSTTSRHVLCDCTASELAELHELMPRTSRPSTHPSLRAKELSIVGLPIYNAKRSLVDQVVDGVAAIARGDGGAALVMALVALIQDGLKDDVNAWKMISTVTAPGPATKDVYTIVKQLEACDKSDSAKAEIFFEELLKENSLDCWLCYVVLKENVLRKLYAEGGFLLNAPSAYRSLLWRLVDALAMFPVLEAREVLETKSMMWGGASRMHSDSRVPKSSSVPSRLATQPHHYRPSRIPQPTHRPAMSRTLSLTRSIPRSPMASVLADSGVEEGGKLPGELPVSQGERVRVLSRRGPIARCCRIHPRRNQLITGLVPVSNLLIQ